MKQLAPTGESPTEADFKYFSCWRKIRYATETETKEANKKLHGNKLAYYFCTYCDGFHITHRGRGLRRVYRKFLSPADSKKRLKI